MQPINVPAELKNMPKGTVIQCLSSWDVNSTPEPVLLCGEFSYVDATEPEVFEAWGLNCSYQYADGSTMYIPELITWSFDLCRFTTGSSNGALDNMTNEQLCDKCTELKRIANLI
jgi:hypothetical protein